MDVLLRRGVGDLRRGQADALVDHLDAAVPRLDGDLLGAVGMAVQPRLADQHLEPPAEPPGQGLDPAAHRLQGSDAVFGNRPHRRGRADAGGRPVEAEDAAQRPAPFAGRHAGMGAGDRQFHDVAAVADGALQFGDCRLRLNLVPRRAPFLEPGDLHRLGGRIDGEEAAVSAARPALVPGAFGERRGRAFGPAVYTDDGLLAGLDRRDPRRIGRHEPLLHVAGLDRGHGAAHRLDPRHFGGRLALQFGNLVRDLGRAVENVAILQQVGLVGEDLLQAQRPLLVPRPGQAERLVPGRQLHRPRPRPFRQGDRQRLEQDAVDVVLRLLLGQAEGIDLDAVAKAAQLRIRDAVARLADFVPQLGEGAHLADFGDEAQPGIDEEADPADRGGKIGRRHRIAHPVEHRDGGGERIGQLLHRRRPGLLQMVAADVDRVPFRRLAAGEGDHVGGEPHRGFGRKDVGAAGEIFLDDIVLGRAGEFGPLRALPFGRRDIEREQPRRRRVDRHRRVHPGERDIAEQGLHVAEMGHRHADLADLAARQRIVGVVAGLGRQVEGDRESGLPLGQVGPVQIVRRRGRGMARICPHDPGTVPSGAALLLRPVGSGCVVHGLHPGPDEVRVRLSPHCIKNAPARPACASGETAVSAHILHGTQCHEILTKNPGVLRNFMSFCIAT